MIKKILLGIFGLVLLLIAGLAIFGWMNPSISYESSVEINKPREVVWNYFSDESKMSEWLTGFQKIENISGNKNEVGSKWRLTFVENGSEVVMTETVKDFKAPERFSMLLDHEIMSNDVAVTLTEKDGKTIMTQKETVVGKNFFWRTMFAVIKSSFSARSLEALNLIKRNVEKL